METSRDAVEKEGNDYIFKAGWWGCEEFILLLLLRQYIPVIVMLVKLFQTTHHILNNLFHDEKFKKEMRCEREGKDQKQGDVDT